MIGKIIGYFVLFLVVCYLLGFNPAALIGDVVHAATVMHSSSTGAQQ